MKKLNNKGFTLIEILAAVSIVVILGLIATPSIINTINTSNNANYDILVKNITIAGKQLFEEIEYTKPTIYKYTENGKSTTEISISSNTITVNLQTLVSNGFLIGSDNPNTSGSNKNHKIITNPKTKTDIGTCSIIITKTVDTNYNTNYEIKNNSTSSNCPKDTEYTKALKGA